MHQQKTVKATPRMRKGARNAVVRAAPESSVWNAVLEKTVWCDDQRLHELDPEGELQLTDIKVPGRKMSVRMVTAFMDELSRDILYEMSTLVALSCCVTTLKT